MSVSGVIGFQYRPVDICSYYHNNKMLKAIMGGHMNVSSDPTAETIDILRELGLTEYEAKCFLGLTQVSSATATELSRLVDVPRSRVYDIGERLSERGLVEIKQGDPTRFRAISIESAINKLQRKYQSHLAELEDRLYELEPPGDGSDDADGIWTLRGRENVIDRAQWLCDTVDQELLVVTSSLELVDDGCLRRMSRAVNRGTRVIVVSQATDVIQAVTEAAPDATVIEPQLDWLDSTTGEATSFRIVMADRESVLLTTSHRSPSMDGAVGVWASGPDNGLVAVAGAILGRWLDDVVGATPPT